MSGWWVCGMCETANTPTAVICEVCECRRGTAPSRGLKGDLIERATSRPKASPGYPTSARVHAAALGGSGVTPPSPATWHQRLRAGAEHFYNECAAIIRSVLRALS